VASEPPADPDTPPARSATRDPSGDPVAVSDRPSEPIDSPSPDPSAEPPAGAPLPPAVEDPADARLSLVEPERLGSVVEPAKTRGGPTRIIVPLTLPEQPGRYRLVATLHDATGVAYDAATQALLPGVLVQVSGDVGARYLIGATATATAGGQLEVRAGVANLGATTWGRERVEIRHREFEEAAQATVVAHWVNLTPITAALPPEIRLPLPAGLEFGATARVTFAGAAPTDPGQYLLVIDVIDPELGSLAALGIEPGLVRVTVEAAPG
jgi:hypothetical protein